MFAAIKQIQFNLSIYLAYAFQNLKVKLSYPWDFFANLIGTFAYGVMNVLFLWVLLSKTTDIVGWTFPELVFLYGMGELCFGMFALFFFHMSMRLSEHYIVEGNLDRLLMRPIPPLMQLMMENLDLFDIVVLIKGAVLVGWAWSQMPDLFTVGNVLALILGVGIGSAVYMGIFLAVGSVSFWMPNRGRLMMPIFSLNDVSRYPITIYPLGIRIFFSYVIPFAFAAFYPTVWVLRSGPMAWQVLAASGGIAIVTIAVGYTIFRFGLARYESTGT